MLATLATAGVAATAGCTTDSITGDGDGSIRAPDRTAVGDPLRIGLVDFDPDASVTVRATADDANGRTYRGSWSLRTDDEGAAALADAEMTEGSIESTWYGPERGRRVGDPSSFETLLHRLSSTALFGSPPSFVAGERNAIDLTVEAGGGLLGGSPARHTQSRLYLDPEVSRERVEADGLVGWLYAPSTQGPHRGVLTLHGSHAAVPHRYSRLLTTHGFAALALQYFDAPGLPEYLSEIPLEYFDRAIRWLTGRDDVHSDGIGVVGSSSGVEAALLVAAGYDGPATAVGYSGGGVVTPGVVGVPPRTYSSKPAWTRDGEPVVPTDAVGEAFDAVREAYDRRCDVESSLAAVDGTDAERAIDRTLVPVEDVDGPVLLLAGADDRQWPSVPMAALAIRRLRRHAHPHPYGLRTYCDVGHVFGVPYANYRGSATDDTNGGVPQANAKAAADSWPLVLDYLNRG